MTQTRSAYLYFCASAVAFTCVAYELLLGSYATFLMGASVLQYSLVISLMMLSMGIGALLTKAISNNSFSSFLSIELLLCWCALLAVPLMYLSFCLNFAPKLTLILFVSLLGLGIGMEIPLLSQINSSHKTLTKILFSDYSGGFFGGIAFPIILFPYFGFFRIGAMLGLINALMSASFFVLFKEKISGSKMIWGVLIASTVIACFTELLFAERLRTWMEFRFFAIQ